MANERFSGKGHARHICKACSKLDGTEKVYRQALVDLDRARRHTYPLIHKSKRKWFDGLASSANDTIRKLHAEVTAEMTAEREEKHRLREEDERAMEEYAIALENAGAYAEATPYDCPDTDDELGDDIPF